MDRSKVLTLIAKSYTQDAIGQQVPVETQRDVYCNISGVSGQEFFEAGRSGIRPEIRVTLFAFDYNSETVVELEGCGMVCTAPISKTMKILSYIWNER